MRIPDDLRMSTESVSSDPQVEALQRELATARRDLITAQREQAAAQHEQAAAQRELATVRQRATLLEDFVEQGAIGLHWVGPDGIVLWANAFELQLLGYAREEYVGHHIAEFHADQPTIADILRRLSANEVLCDYEARLRCRNGDIRTVLINSSVLWQDGRFVHTRCFTRDITDQKRSEAALHESEQALQQESVHWQMLTEAMPQLVWTCMADGQCDYLSAQWVAYTGIPAAAQLGTAWIEQVHPDDRGSLADAWRHATTAIVPFETRFRIRRHDGVYRCFQTRAVPSFAADGSVAKWFGTNTDIADLVRIQDELNRQAHELRRVNAELEHFATIASHDLQEPLRMISSYSGLIMRRSGGQFDEKTRGHFAHITAAAVRMRDLVNALLDYSHVDKKPIATSELAITDALSDALGNLSHEIEQSGAVIDLGDLPVVQADRVRVAQLLQNLVANALKFADPQRPLRIRIGAHQDQGIPVIVVRDNGIGISLADQERIFQIFQRLHAPGQYPGSGIGLATCRKIVEQHGGRIWVESRAGEGAAFLFTLSGA